jgi:glycosyltransferase involved in cell wall biosynthesis
MPTPTTAVAPSPSGDPAEPESGTSSFDSVTVPSVLAMPRLPEESAQGTGRPPRVVLIDLGRATASGARRHLASLAQVVEAAGFDVEILSLLPRYRARPLDSIRRVPAALRARRCVPETLAWSPRRVQRELELLEPDAIVCVTSRCFHPELKGPWRTYIDMVDQLSASYSSRATISDSPLATVGYRALARCQRRFEASSRDLVDGAFAAGLADANALGVEWIPITASGPAQDAALSAPGVPDTDVLFIGTLDYAPNVDAVVELSELWPHILELRPHTTAIIAGARPTDQVRAIARARGWELIPDFDEAGPLYRRARLAVAPLRHANGIQIKVLDAASAGIPQVVSTAVARGLDPDFPLVTSDGTDEWVRSIVALLDDSEEARRLGQASRDHVSRNYSTDVVATRLRAIIEGAPNPR